MRKYFKFSSKLLRFKFNFDIAMRQFQFNLVWINFLDLVRLISDYTCQMCTTFDSDTTLYVSCSQ